VNYVLGLVLSQSQPPKYLELQVRATGAGLAYMCLFSSPTEGHLNLRFLAIMTKDVINTSLKVFVCEFSFV
jgi:hypothetical protein